jgi:phosphohistidine phosphatase
VRRSQIAPQLVLCSSSARTRETLAALALAPEPVVLFERGLYAASEDVLLARLRAVREDVTSAMLVGHSSGIEDLAILLAGSGPRLRALRDKFPTGGLASLAFEGSWRKLGRGDARLTDYVVPRDLAAS